MRVRDESKADNVESMQEERKEGDEYVYLQPLSAERWHKGRRVAVKPARSNRDSSSFLNMELTMSKKSKRENRPSISIEKVGP
jgi:hypothetical protein